MLLIVNILLYSVKKRENLKKMIEEIQNKLIQIIYSTLFEVQLSIFTISHSPNRFNYCNDFKKKKKLKKKKTLLKVDGE